MTVHQHLAALSPEQEEMLEQIVRAFDLARQRGQQPNLADLLPPDHELRNAVLVELLLTDAEYRCKEGEERSLESWLKQFPELASESLLQELRASWPAPSSTSETCPVRPNEIESLPHRLGRFDLLELIGRGSFGTVYRAHDTELGRVVAVKIPHAGRGANLDASRFHREARSAARLRHPGIVPVYDVGEVNSVCYLVCDFVAGTTLADRLRQRSSSLRDAAELVAQIADALDYAHRQGVVHRDIKPANILLDTDGRPHITDFGLARNDADATLTGEGDILGTPAYISPEQARGDARSVDARTDVYSLGVILYELLTAEIPFRGTGRMVLLQVLEDEPRPPHRIVEGVPRELAVICLKAMAKEPGERYQLAGELAADLRRWLTGEPVRARPVGAFGRLKRWCRRRPGIASLAAALILTVTGGLAATTWQWRRAEMQRERAEEQFRTAYTAVRDFHYLLFEDDRFDHPNYQPLRRAALVEAVQHYESFLSQSPKDPELRAAAADAYYQLGFSQRTQGMPELARVSFEQALSLWESLTREQPEVSEHWRFLAKTASHLGDLYHEDGRREQAMHAYQRALEIRAKLAGDHPDNDGLQQELASSHYSIAQLRCEHKEYAAALRAADGARAIRERLRQRHPRLAQNRRRLALTYRLIGCIHRGMGSLKDAKLSFQQAQAIQEEMLRDEPGSPTMTYDFAGTLLVLGSLTLEQEQRTEARQHFLQAQQALGQLAKKYPTIVSYQRALGESYSWVGTINQAEMKWAEAEQNLEAARAIFEKLHRQIPTSKIYRDYLTNSIDTLVGILMQLGHAQYASHDWQDAVESFGRGIRLQEQLFLDDPARPTEEHYRLAILYFRRGQVLEHLGRGQAALTDFQQAIHHDRLAAERHADPQKQHLREDISRSYARLRAKVQPGSPPDR